MIDGFAGIPDREYYQYGAHPNPDGHLLFAPWGGLGALGHHLAESSTPFPSPKYYFLYTACMQGLAATGGEVWELGVYKGDSAAFLASIAGSKGRTTRLFDTFAGMPETDPDRDFHKAGDFADTSLDQVKARVAGIPAQIAYHPGFVPETFAGQEDREIAFAHIDLDIYHPIKAAAEFIFPRMAVGGAMIFDDYGWASCPGARMAVDEYFQGRPEQVFSLPTGQAMVIKVSAA